MPDFIVGIPFLCLSSKFKTKVICYVLGKYFLVVQPNQEGLDLLGLIKLLRDCVVKALKPRYFQLGYGSLACLTKFLISTQKCSVPPCSSTASSRSPRGPANDIYRETYRLIKLKGFFFLSVAAATSNR